MALVSLAACPAFLHAKATPSLVIGSVMRWPGKSQGRGVCCCQ